MNVISAAMNAFRKFMNREHRGCKDALAEEGIGETDIFCCASVSFADGAEIDRADK